MKKSISFLILALGFVFVFLSCEQEEEFINNQEVIKSKNIFIKKVTDPVLIKQFQSKLSMLKSAGGTEFDTQNIYEVGLTESSPKVLVANQVGFDECNESNYGLANAVDENGDLGTPTIVETKKLEDDIRIINYYDHSYNLLISLELNSNSERIEVLYKQASLKSTGQDVADCIGDVYTNHGWVSVWTWVQSAFIPETVVAIAAACVGANL